MASDAWAEIARDLGRFRSEGAGFRKLDRGDRWHRALDHLRRQTIRPRSAELEQDVQDLSGPLSTHDQPWSPSPPSAPLHLVRGLPRDQAEAVLLHLAVARVLSKRPGAERPPVAGC